MPRGCKEKVRHIEVRPVSANDTDHILTYDESCEHVPPADRDWKYLTTSLHRNLQKDQHIKTNIIETSLEEKRDNTHVVQNVINQMEQAEQIQSKVVDEISKLNGDEICNATASQADLVGDHTNAKNGKKKKKKAKKKKKKKEKENEADAISEEPKDVNTDGGVQEIEKAAVEIVSSKAKCSKLPCLFGFVSSWLAKRKERRRAKKRKAIESRASTPVQPLVEYEHKKSKGGVAFTVEVDSRPMRKSVLPPIKQRQGGVLSEIDEKMKLVENKRSEELDKRKKSSQEHGKRVGECHERKAENEFYYKQKVDLTIKHKQGAAKRNRTRLQRDRCSSSLMLRAPSTLPPLRNARVKRSADTSLNGSSNDGANNPDDEIFNF